MKKIILILICVLAYSTANACNNHGEHNHSKEAAVFYSETSGEEMDEPAFSQEL